MAGGAVAQDLAQPFDGEVLAALDLYGQVCPDAMVGDDTDDSGSWRKTMRRAALTGGTIALYLNRDDAEDGAATEDEDAMADEDTDAAADDADDKSSKDDGKPTEDSSDDGSDKDSGAGDGNGEGSGNGWLSDRWDALRDWLSELVNA